MGIPRLSAHLRPYGATTTLGCSTEGCSKHIHQQQVVIDGPGLAYHIYYRVLAQKLVKLNATDALPSYKEIGLATLAFMNELSEHTVTIEKIYFDGFLPLQKYSTRISRLESYLRQLVTFQSTYSKGIRLGESAEMPQITYQDILNSSRPITLTNKGLPAAPFLVPAVIETLSTSSYARAIEIVPGEADSYCADAAYKLGCIVLTSDSDMLVHDLGSQGAMAFLNQVEIRDADAAAICPVIQAYVHKPSEIAERLKLEDLVRLAFEVKEDSRATLQEAVQCAKGYLDGASKQEDFDIFSREYRRGIPLPEMLEVLPEDDIGLFSTRRHLDPRVSELVLQAPQESISMFLPFLIDDPSRASAWLIGSSIRCLAYSFLRFRRHSFRGQSSIVEHSRKGYRMMHTKVVLHSKQQCIEEAQEFVEDLSVFREHTGVVSSSVFWRLYGIKEVCKWYSETAREIPTTKALKRVMIGTATKLLTWEDIHLTAQLESALYSLRILKQVAHLRDIRLSADTSLVQKALHEGLNDLPALDTLMPSRLELKRDSISSVETESHIALAREAFVMKDARIKQEEKHKNNAVEPKEGSSLTWSIAARKPGKRHQKSKPVPAKASNESSRQPSNIYNMLQRS